MNQRPPPPPNRADPRGAARPGEGASPTHAAPLPAAPPPAAMAQARAPHARHGHASAAAPATMRQPRPGGGPRPETPRPNRPSERGNSPGPGAGPGSGTGSGTGAGPGSGIDRHRAAAARRHSVFVALMKGLLPSLAVCIIVALVFYSQGAFAPDLPDGVEFDPGEIDVTDTSVRMISPLLTGLDNENRRFEVTAVTAVQDRDNPGLVSLEGINGSMEMEDGGWLTLDAAGGIYDSDTNMLSLADAIEVTTSAGYVARLNGAEVDFKKGEVATVRPVVVYMDAGVITGNAMTLFHKERRAVFTDGVSMTINGDPSQGSAGQ